MKPSPAHFIGYGRLEDLVAAHADPSEPFYVEFLSRRIPGDPIGWTEQTVLVQDFDPEGRVRYVRIPCGGYDLIHGTPFDEARAQEARERGSERHEAVLGYLTSRGYRVERAAIAMPRDLILLDGYADVLDPGGGTGVKRCRQGAIRG